MGTSVIGIPLCHVSSLDPRKPEIIHMIFSSTKQTLSQYGHGSVHAYLGVVNGPSKTVCRKILAKFQGSRHLNFFFDAFLQSRFLLQG